MEVTPEEPHPNEIVLIRHSLALSPLSRGQSSKTAQRVGIPAAAATLTDPPAERSAGTGKPGAHLAEDVERSRLRPPAEVGRRRPPQAGPAATWAGFFAAA